MAANNPAASPTSPAAPNANAMVVVETVKIGNRVPTRAAKTFATGKVKPIPSRPPETDRNKDSPMISPSTCLEPNPRAFSVAYSRLRSRTAIVIVFAATARMMAITNSDTI